MPPPVTLSRGVSRFAKLKAAARDRASASQSEPAAVPGAEQKYSKLKAIAAKHKFKQKALGGGEEVPPTMAQMVPTLNNDVMVDAAGIFMLLLALTPEWPEDVTFTDLHFHKNVLTKIHDDAAFKKLRGEATQSGWAVSLPHWLEFLKNTRDKYEDKRAGEQWLNDAISTLRTSIEMTQGPEFVKKHAPLREAVILQEIPSERVDINASDELVSEPVMALRSASGNDCSVMAVMHYGYQRNIEIPIGENTWFAVSGNGAVLRTMADNISEIACEIEAGSKVRVDYVQEVDGAQGAHMRCHISEPQVGWVSTWDLECVSHTCGLCSRCDQIGPHARLPSENADAPADFQSAIAVLSYGLEPDVEVSIGPEAWFTVASLGPLKGKSPGVNVRSAMGPNADVSGEVSMGSVVRLTAVAEVVGTMYGCLVAPEGWLQFCDLECKSGNCGFCSRCESEGPHAVFPSQTKALSPTPIASASVLKQPGDIQQTGVTVENASNEMVTPNSDQVLRERIKRLEAENKRMSDEAFGAVRDAEERFINYGAHLHKSLDEASLRVQADSAIIDKFQEALRIVADENKKLLADVVTNTAAGGQSTGIRKPRVKSVNWPIPSRGGSLPCPFANVATFENMSRPR